MNGKLKMQINIKDLVKNKMAHFSHYREGYFYYKTDDNFQFSIPFEDTTGITLPAQDKAIFFMKWMKKQIDLQKNS